MKLAAILVLAILLLPPPAAAHNTGHGVTAAKENAAAAHSTAPRPKPGGGKWRLGLYVSGDFKDFPVALHGIVLGLRRLGWIGAQPEIPDNFERIGDLWRWLAANVRSDTVEFVADGFWAPGYGDEKHRLAARDAFVERLRERHDIDLVISMGTRAGQDMVTVGAPVPTVVTSSSDPLAAGIVRSVGDSGIDNLHVQMEPERFHNQLRLFHDAVGFKTLGFAYEDTPEGRLYAAVDIVEQVARERNIRLIPCRIEVAVAEAPGNGVKLMACYRHLAQEADAVYVFGSVANTPEFVAELAKVLRDARTPSFSMNGGEEVRAGIMMSLADSNKRGVGLFHAETIARILNGATPRSLDQVWTEPSHLALNLDTIRRIGFNPPLEVLLAAEEVYDRH
jgi:ABC-type uncharacterized transport system substrate-binding protein